MVETSPIRGRLLRVTGVALLCALMSCSARQLGNKELDQDARAYLKLAVALGQRDADSQDYYYGPAPLVADTLAHPPSLQEIDRSAVALMERVKKERPADEEQQARRSFLAGQLQALASRAQLLGGAVESFDAETQGAFGVTVPASYNQAKIDATQSELEKLLPGKGPLAERYQSFEGRFLVPPADVKMVLTAAIEGCRKETAAHLALPAGEKIRVEYVSNRPWSGYSWYKGNYQSVVQINRDFAMTVDGALQLACHETYPGHHTYNMLREAEMVRGKGRIEYTVQPTYSPQSLISESMATIAAEVAFPEEKRLRFEREVLFPLAGLDGKTAQLYLHIEGLVDALHPTEPVIARHYLDGTLEFERAGEQLTSAALMTHPEPALKYMNEYRSYVATYTYGRDLATEWIQQHSQPNEESRWNAYKELMMQDASALCARVDATKCMDNSRAGGV
jgi:hypothetical protein